MSDRQVMVRTGRMLYAILAWIFLLCILTQAFIAGWATFSNPGAWAMHTSFVKMFAILPLVMFLLTWLGKISSWHRWVSLTLFLLMILQFQTVELFSSVSVIAALHPVIALLLFWGSIMTVRHVGNK